MAIADRNFHDGLDNAHTVNGQGSFRPKYPKFFKYDISSEGSKEARRRVGRRCTNCASEDNFLRACDRDYINHFDQFIAEFSTGSAAEVDKRWQIVQGRMRRKNEQAYPLKGSPSP